MSDHDHAKSPDTPSQQKIAPETEQEMPWPAAGLNAFQQNVMHLQRKIGNQATIRHLAATGRIQRAPGSLRTDMTNLRGMNMTAAVLSGPPVPTAMGPSGPMMPGLITLTNIEISGAHSETPTPFADFTADPNMSSGPASSSSSSAGGSAP